MSLISDTWVPGLSQSGPPPGANNHRYELRGVFQCPTLADLRALETHRDNDRMLVVLQGQDAAFDGLLQGIYCYVPTGSHRAQSDSATWVIVNDGQSAWQKLT